MVDNIATVVNASGGIANGAIVLMVSGGVLPYSYLWDDPNNSTTLEVSELAPGDYKVVVTDARGCTAVETYTVGELTSIQKIQGVSLQIYPNPVKDKLVLEWQGIDIPEVLVRIFNTEGMLVESEMVSAMRKTFDVSNLASGLYMVEIRDLESGEGLVKRVVVE